MTARWLLSLRTLLARLWPHPLPVAKKQMAIASFGAGLGLMITSLISHKLLGEVNLRFVAPMGASAVLLFGLPNSPLAQPWSIVGGNLVAGLIGVTTAMYVPYPALACGIAASLAIAVMFQLRCLHPPSGAVALTAILGGSGVQQLGYHFILTPVLLNSLCLALLAVLFNNLAGRRYPHPLADVILTRWRRVNPSLNRLLWRSLLRAPTCTKRWREANCSILMRTICSSYYSEQKRSPDAGNSKVNNFKSRARITSG